MWAIVDHEATFGIGEIGQSCGIPGDLDDDADVDLDDYAIWASRLNGPCTPAVPGCESADLDSDGDVDLADHAMFAILLTGFAIPQSITKHGWEQTLTEVFRQWNRQDSRPTHPVVEG